MLLVDDIDGFNLFVSDRNIKDDCWVGAVPALGLHNNTYHISLEAVTLLHKE